MTIFCGMDTEAVRSLAARTDAGRARAEAATAHCTAAGRAARWSGPDAAAFDEALRALRQEAEGILSPALLAFARDLEAEADAQDAASTAGSTVGAPGSAGIAGPVAAVAAGAAGRCAAWPPAHETAVTRAALFEIRAGLIALGLDDLLRSAPAPAPAPPAPSPGPPSHLPFLPALRSLLPIDLDGVLNHRDAIVRTAEILQEWRRTGEAPAVSELGASLLLTAGTGSVAVLEMNPWFDTGLLDGRTDVTVTASRDLALQGAPVHLSDLVMDTHEARSVMPGDPDGLDRVTTGQIRIQEIVPAGGGESVYIVHCPPTGGASIIRPEAWGAQGNSSGWDSNVRAMAGLESASMADVRAAMASPGADGRPLVPAGAKVLLVGHSQGGIVAAHLAADPSFNATGGAAGSYEVTQTFSVGAPVQTVEPARAGTGVWNLAHSDSSGPFGLGVPDPVATLDAGGVRLDGERISSPRVHDVQIDVSRPTLGGEGFLHDRHGSVLDDSGTPDPTGGYYGTLLQQQEHDPRLRELETQLEGTYIGEDVVLVQDSVVEVGRDDLRGRG